LICEVIQEGGKKGYRVTGQGSYLNFLPDQLTSPFVVSPTGDSDKTTGKPHWEPTRKEP
jgi:hypothetical protein